LATNHLDFDPNQLSQEGLNLLNEGEFKQSLEIFNKLNTHFPNNPDLLNLIAFANLQLEFFDEALLAYTNSININPNQIGALFNRAIVNEKLGNLNEALNDYDTALKLDPNNLDIYQNKSAIFEDLGEFESALESIDHAIKKNPINYHFYLNRGNIYEYLSRYDDALDDFEKVIEIEPQNPNAYINKGNLLKKINKIKESKTCLEYALKLDKKSYLAQYNLSLLLLHQKNFELGWKLYESSRFYVSESCPDFIKPIAELEKFDCKDKIFIWGEQGVGDQVFYGSFLRFLDHSLDITVGIDKRLVSIFKRSFQNLKFTGLSEKNLGSDFTKQMSIGSLGNFFAREHLEQPKPSNFLKSDEKRKNVLEKEILSEDKLICGISWRTLNKKTGRWRSLTLEKLLPILRENNFHYIDLQYDDTDREINDFEKKYGIKIQSLKSLDKYNDLEGIFSLIDCCDIVVTIDNSIAHFSGALGKKTFLMLPFGVGSIWYWHDDDISSWYPSIKIYRQSKSGDWHEVIKKIAKDLNTNF
jgi:tetratricopeptide (TPR) repeat protein